VEKAKKEVTVDDLSEEYLSAKTLRSLQGIELALVTTERDFKISVKVPWRAMRIVFIVIGVLWTAFGHAGTTALGRTLTKIIQ
jgi:hypothetical protein